MTTDDTFSTMTIRLIALSLAVVFHVAPSGFAKDQADTVAPTELHAKGGGRVWVYLPPNATAESKVACVLVPPAGSRLFHGMSLGEGDRAEHLPYVAAGFAVVSFDVSGPWPDAGGAAAQQNAIRAFMNSKLGINDAVEALQLALGKYPQIDPHRIYAAGHSSAGTLVLQIAASSPEIRGCAAFAPVPDLEAHLGAKTIKAIDSLVPGMAKLMHDESPINQIAALRCPLFLFHAEDDATVPTASIAAYREGVSAHHKQFDYIQVTSGGHYDSMIRQGIPKAIAWLTALDQKPK